MCREISVTCCSMKIQPIQVFMAIEALADGGVLGGLDRENSVRLAAQTVMASIFLHI